MQHYGHTVLYENIAGEVMISTQWQKTPMAPRAPLRSTAWHDACKVAETRVAAYRVLEEVDSWESLEDLLFGLENIMLHLSYCHWQDVDQWASLERVIYEHVFYILFKEALPEPRKRHPPPLEGVSSL